MQLYVLNISYCAHRFLSIHCQKYQLDYRGEPYYQFFDSPKYSLEEGSLSVQEEQGIASALEEEGFTYLPPPPEILLSSIR